MGVERTFKTKQRRKRDYPLNQLKPHPCPKKEGA
jgi:hypothetical protein